jgi:hypothetical protein
MKYITQSKKNTFGKTSKSAGSAAFMGLAIALTTSCTGQIPSSYALQQQVQNFNAQIDINTKIDLLFVVDNSSSMNAEQDRLRAGFQSFANTYMQPTWDIQAAVISTDTYLANPAFSGWLNTMIPGTKGYVSPYVSGLVSAHKFTNPASSPNLVNLGAAFNNGGTNIPTGGFENGVSYGDLVPTWGSAYGTLIAGMHDGPISALCFEGLPYFLYDAAGCNTRDVSTTFVGTADCLNPPNGTTADEMCINTVENDTVRSGIAIIKTMPSTTLTGAALTSWNQQLVNDFEINATTGVTGMGSERGLGSVIEMINDNEVPSGSTTKFFRAGALRGIIFVTDEDDQTMNITAGSQVGPWDNYSCDQSSLETMNSGNPNNLGYTIPGSFCCAGGGCTFGTGGLSCPAKAIDSTHNLTVSICPSSADLTPVATIKSQLDDFFNDLDGGTNPNYFVATITPLTSSSITTLQAIHDSDDKGAGYPVNKAADRGDRYLDLGNLVGNGSLSLDISSSDYSPLLNQIGQTLLLQKSTFTLSRVPTSSELMIITLIHADSTSEVIPSSDYTISGSSVIITDQALVLSFVSTDQLSINYEPKFVTQ